MLFWMSVTVENRDMLTTEHEATWDLFWEVSSFQKTTKNSLTSLKLCLKPVYSYCSLMSISRRSAQGNAKYSNERGHSMPKPFPWHSNKAPTQAKCIPALIHSSTMKVLFNDSAWKKTQNLFLYENFHILQRIKVFNLEILEKISWNMQLQSFYIRLLFELRVKMK